MIDQAGSLWDFYIPDNGDPGYRWLAHRAKESSLNLLGPFGQEFELAQQTRALLLLADLESFPLILPLVSSLLDRAGRVVLLIKGEPASAEPYLAWIPIPVELRIVPLAEWDKQLSEPLRWADQLCASLPNKDYPHLAQQVRAKRFQLDTSFAHVLVYSELLCGVGACLACVVSTLEGGYTRACIHGPVFPLASLYQ
jgi:dihydroorotate dehydrogenase electron transfer subunit